MTCMPELPEVETIRQDLKHKILGHVITSVTIRRKKMVRNSLPVFHRTLIGNAIVDIERRGKLLVCQLQQGEYDLLVHLKMTGQLIYQWDGKMIAGGHTQPPVGSDMPNAYSHIIIEFDNGSRLYFNDMRVFGFMRLVTPQEKESVLSQYGPEPLLDQFSITYLTDTLHRRKTSLKAVLMNQSLIAGIGNIYADESCFRARIRPDRLAGSLSLGEVVQLHRAIRSVLKKAILERGTTFNSYIDPEGRKGNFLRFLKVYGRGAKPCTRCGQPLQKKKVAGRGTVYCASCQR